MIPAISSSTATPYQIFEDRSNSTVQKIITVAMLAIAGFALGAACLPMEGTLIAFTVGGAVLMLATVTGAHDWPYFDTPYSGYRAPLSFYRPMSFSPVITHIERPPVFVEEILRPSFSFTRPLSHLSGERVRVGSGHIGRRESFLPSTRAGFSSGERVRVGSRY